MTQAEAEEEGDPVYIQGRTARVVRAKARRGRPRRDGPGSGQQPLSCKHCHKTFSKRLQLKAHEAVHGANAEKPFQCLQCGRGFSFERSLTAHMLLHTGACRGLV
jgi:hypothetical protein